MNDVAIVKEGWLHKRGQCPWARPGRGSGASLAVSVAVAQACCAGAALGLLDRPVSVLGPRSPRTCRAWPRGMPGGDWSPPGARVAGSGAAAWPGPAGAGAVAPAPLSWKAVRTLGPGQGLAAGGLGRCPRALEGRARCWAWPSARRGRAVENALRPWATGTLELELAAPGCPAAPRPGPRAHRAALPAASGRDPRPWPPTSCPAHSPLPRRPLHSGQPLRPRARGSCPPAAGGRGARCPPRSLVF